MDSPANLAILWVTRPATLPIIDYKLIQSLAEKMRCAIAFMLLMLAVVSIDPVCEVNSPLSDKIYNAPNELQALDLSNYFRGYNLQYNISVDSP